MSQLTVVHMKHVLYPLSFNEIQENYQSDTHFEFVT